MASMNTILSDVGHFFKRVFTSPVTLGIEKGIDVFAQTPLAALLISPAGAALLKNSIEAIENVEMMSIAAGQQSGSGAQKAALVMQTIEQAYNTFAAAQNPPLPVTPKTLAAFVDAFVAVANSFPSGIAAATPTVQTQAATGTLL